MGQIQAKNLGQRTEKHSHIPLITDFFCIIGIQHYLLDKDINNSEILTSLKMMKQKVIQMNIYIYFLHLNANYVLQLNTTITV